MKTIHDLKREISNANSVDDTDRAIDLTVDLLAIMASEAAKLDQWLSELDQWLSDQADARIKEDRLLEHDCAGLLEYFPD